MIRLLGQFPSANDIPHTRTSPLSHSHRSPSLSIRLGPRRKRMHTLQPACASLFLSANNAKAQSFETSCIDPAGTAISKAGTTSPNSKIKRLGLKQGQESADRQGKLEGLLSGLSACLGQSPQKQKQQTQRQVVRLRHRKTKSHSPIQKLLQLLGEEQGVPAAEGGLIF